MTLYDWVFISYCTFRLHIRCLHVTLSIKHRISWCSIWSNYTEFLSKQAWKSQRSPYRFSDSIKAHWMQKMIEKASTTMVYRWCRATYLQNPPDARILRAWQEDFHGAGKPAEKEWNLSVYWRCRCYFSCLNFIPLWSEDLPMFCNFRILDLSLKDSQESAQKIMICPIILTGRLAF